MENEFEEIIPLQVLFSLTELQNMSILRRTTAKKFISDGILCSTRIGKKHYISRFEIIKFLSSNTKSANNISDDVKLTA